MCCDGRNGQFNPIGNGAGSRVYVADTGILTSHSEFAGGRAVAGYDAITPTTNSEDCNGHGTHVAGSVLRVAFPSTCGVAWWLLSCIVVGVCVAGTVAGANYGVARSATVVAVRVLSCSGSGSTSGIVAGINWIIADTAVPVRALLVVAYGDLVEIASRCCCCPVCRTSFGVCAEPCHGLCLCLRCWSQNKQKLLTMSLGGGFDAALNAAVTSAWDNGIAVTVAAGNENSDACNVSPASAPAGRQRVPLPARRVPAAAFHTPMSCCVCGSCLCALCVCLCVWFMCVCVFYVFVFCVWFVCVCVCVQ